MKVGFDVIDVTEISTALETFGFRYLQKVSSPREFREYQQMDRPVVSTIAQRFALKEAVVKALPALSGAMSWRDLDVQLDDGVWSLSPSERANNRLRLDWPSSIHVSVSVNRSRAWACVVVDTEE